MQSKRRVRCWLLAGMLLCLTARAEAFVFISEILADPPVGLSGDANNDGVTSSTGDEFVELFNNGGSAVDLSGWSLHDSINPRHVFPVNSILSADEILVIFGGGAPQLPGINWQVASSGGLSLNNSGDTVSLFDTDGQLVDQIVYGSEAGRDQSLARSPEGDGDQITQHLLLPDAAGRRFSPGFFVDPPVQTEIPDSGAAAVPEPATMLSLAAGLISLGRLRKGDGKAGKGA